MRKVHIGRSLFVVVLAMLLLRCSEPISTDDEKESIKNTISTYNSLLTECYRKMDMNDLRRVATREHIEKVYLHMAALGEQALKLDSKLIRLTFNEIRLLNNSEAEARTTEVWDFKHINYLENKVVRDEKGVRYDLIYRLKKIPYHGWIVTDVKQDDRGIQNYNRVYP